MSIADKIKEMAQKDPKIAAINAERERLRGLTDTTLENLIQVVMKADPTNASWEMAEKQILALCKRLAYTTRTLEESFAIDRREAEGIEDAKRLLKKAKFVKVTTWHGQKIQA